MVNQKEQGVSSIGIFIAGLVSYYCLKGDYAAEEIEAYEYLWDNGDF